jgi:putative nucleotidyltransferase with HDIG domain
LDSKTFFQKLDRIPDIPTLPNVVVKVNEMLRDYDTSIKKLSGIIENDQAMVSKILRLVNSTFYGFKSEVKNLPHAVIILGFNTIRNAIVSVAIVKVFSGKEGFEGFEITDFWKHSVAVAVTSGYLAEQSRLDSPNDCFVAGLLHDIGKVVLSQFFTELFGQVWSLAKKGDLSFYEAEKELLPVTHSRIGGYLAEKWQFPRSLVETTTYHHSIKKTVTNLNQLIIIHTADTIVNTCNAGSKGSGVFSSMDTEAKRTMSDQLKTAFEWFPNLAEEIESACEFFLKEE